MKRAGVSLLVIAYLVLLYTSLAAPAYARAHPHFEPAVTAAYAAAWPVALASVVSMFGIVLALVPVRMGTLWAPWTCAASFVILLVTRLASDPRCLVVFDPHQHGCHTFMIAVVLGIAGSVLSILSRKHTTAS